MKMKGCIFCSPIYVSDARCILCLSIIFIKDLLVSSLNINLVEVYNIVFDKFGSNKFSKEASRRTNFSFLNKCLREFYQLIGIFLVASIRNEVSKGGIKHLQCFSVNYKRLFNHFIIQVIGPLPFFIEIIQNVPWLRNNISVQFHDETSFTKNINDDCQVNHEVMQIATREDLWQFQSFNILVI